MKTVAAEFLCIFHYTFFDAVLVHLGSYWCLEGHLDFVWKFQDSSLVVSCVSFLRRLFLLSPRPRDYIRRNVNG